MDNALRAIADPRRREILRLIRAAELPAGKIAERFDVSRPAISQHLRILKEAGLVVERRDGARRCYRLRPEGMEEIHAFVESFWNLRRHEVDVDLSAGRHGGGAAESPIKPIPEPVPEPPVEPATEPTGESVHRPGRAHLRLISDTEGAEDGTVLPGPKSPAE